MKVHIGPYRTWIGPYQIADAICFWEKKKGEEANLSEKLGDWLAKIDWLVNLCEWVESKKKRKVYVQIDKYDTWSMDDTLSHIILPMLKQLQSTKYGSPFVDDADAPVELRSTGVQVDDNGNVDNNFHKRWDWVMNEMIHAFEWKVSADSCFLDDMEEANRIENGFRLFGKYYQALWD